MPGLSPAKLHEVTIPVVMCFIHVVQQSYHCRNVKDNYY